MKLLKSVTIYDYILVFKKKKFETMFMNTLVHILGSNHEVNAINWNIIVLIKKKHIIWSYPSGRHVFI